MGVKGSGIMIVGSNHRCAREVKDGGCTLDSAVRRGNGELWPRKHNGQEARFAKGRDRLTLQRRA